MEIPNKHWDFCCLTKDYYEMPAKLIATVSPNLIGWLTNEQSGAPKHLYDDCLPFIYPPVNIPPFLCLLYSLCTSKFSERY